MAFTKRDAEAAGWQFVHEQPATVEDLGDGITRTKPGSFRAEKARVGGGMLNEEGETMDLLLVRIESHERLAGAPAETSPEPEKGADLEAGRGTEGAEKFHRDEE